MNRFFSMWNSRRWLALSAHLCVALAFTLVGSLGCSQLSLFHKDEEEEPKKEKKEAVQIETVGDATLPHGLEPLVVETVGLVTGLPGTGSDPEPSPYRAMLLSEMQRRNVPNPNQVLADPSTALVMVRAKLRTGIQEGDTFDVEVRIPSRDRTTSLRGGYLLPCKLREQAILGGDIKQGHPLAVAEGHIMVDPGASGEEDSVVLGRGRILGGSRATKGRSLALVLQPGHQSVRNSAQIGAVIDSRFNTFQRGIKTGVAKPKTDEFIELAVHARYKNNTARYVQVIRAIPLRETTLGRSQRTKQLEQQLLDPFSAARAAIALEAIGHEAVPSLKKGLASTDPEVRFYAAEALAYLDEPECVDALFEAARDEPAFRVFALTALSSFDNVSSYEALRNLLDLPSVETRYGAFRAMWAMDDKDPYVRGESLGNQFSYHVLDTVGTPMVHVTRSFRPEIVLFGKELQFKTPLLLQAGRYIMIQGDGGNQVVITRFAPGEADQRQVVSTRVDEVVRAVVAIGGTYPDVVQALQEAEQKKVLLARFEVDALPQTGRPYERKSDAPALASKNPERRARFTVTNPLPNLFPKADESEKDIGLSPVRRVNHEEETEEAKPKTLGSRVKQLFTREAEEKDKE